MPPRDSGSLGVKGHEPKRCEELFHLQKDLSGATPTRLRQAYATQMVNCMPQTALVRFALHETPHLIDLCRFYATNLYGHRVRTAPRHDHFIDRGKPRGFFLVRQSQSLG